MNSTEFLQLHQFSYIGLIAWAQVEVGWKFYLNMLKLNLSTLLNLMVLEAKFVLLRIQIHPKQSNRGRGYPTLILHFHLRYRGFLGSEDVASLKYR